MARISTCSWWSPQLWSRNRGLTSRDVWFWFSAVWTCLGFCRQAFPWGRDTFSCRFRNRRPPPEPVSGWASTTAANTVSLTGSFWWHSLWCFQKWVWFRWHWCWWYNFWIWARPKRSSANYEPGSASSGTVTCFRCWKGVTVCQWVSLDRWTAHELWIYRSKGGTPALPRPATRRSCCGRMATSREVWLSALSSWISPGSKFTNKKHKINMRYFLPDVVID